MRLDDFIITIAYFSIPVQLLASLYRYPRLQQMPLHIVLLLILFALFIFLCGFGHMLRCNGATNGTLFQVTNCLTAIVSLTTAVYLLPLVPSLMSNLDQTLQDLLELNKETEKSKRRLITFMAFLCHELRTPLFTITSTISFLQDDDLSAEQSSCLDSIEQSSNLMLRIINDVLDINALESTKIELEDRNFDLHNLLEGVHRGMEMKCKNRHGERVEFRFHMSNDVPQIVRGDSTRVMQMVLNLLSNAIKFTEQGFVYSSVTTLSMAEAVQKGLIHSSAEYEGELEGAFTERDIETTDNESDQNDFAVSLLQASAEEGRAIKIRERSGSIVLQLKVQDTGIGISESRLSTIFKPYCQSKLSQYRKYGGTGLGLAILSRLVTIMGGKILVRSKVGEGTTFELFVPMQVPDLSNSNRTTSSGQSFQINTDLLPELHGITSSLDSTSSPAHKSLGKAADGVKSSMPEIEAATTAPFTAVIAPEFLEMTTYPSNTSPSNVHGDAGGKVQPPALNAISIIQKSIPDKGQPSAAAAEKPITVKTKKPPLPKFKIPKGEGVVLVVDDNQLNRKLICKMLDGFNLEHRQATNGQEAIDIMLNSRNYTSNSNAAQFALILMDLSMPVMDGCEATDIIRKHNLLLPIIALTAATIEEGKSRAIAAGVTEYATKPILREDLHAKCVKYISSSSNERLQEPSCLEVV